MDALSPLDGRYKERVNILRKYFTEKSLICKRLEIEVTYLKFIMNILNIDNSIEKILVPDSTTIYTQVKKIEKETNHDVKAVEYYLGNLCKKYNRETYIPYIHIGLTSHDINSISRSLLIKDFIEQEYNIELLEFITVLSNRAEEWNVPMLAKTHGQSATPTNMCKEMKVYFERLFIQTENLNNIEHRCKLGGASGGLNALYFAYPDITWENQFDIFCKRLNLSRHKYTTQIDHYDNFAEIFDNIRRINIILIDLCQDIWLYCSSDYFKLKIKEGEVGSSTMPHKVNPIDFENAEGNLKIANSLLNLLSEKLPVSRLQRDLTDSTVSRNIGIAFGYSWLAIQSIKKGFEKLVINSTAIIDELNSNYVILGEAVQTVLRKNGHRNAYSKIKKLTRNNAVLSKYEYIDMVKQLDINKEDKNRLLKLTPESYRSYA